MDFIRSCYKTQMQFDQEGQIVAGVQWYFAEPGAKLWHGPNAFCSSVWDEVPYSTAGIGEVWNVPRTFVNGAMPYPSPGRGRFCGKHHWFAEGAPSDAPPLVRGPDGQPHCCGGKPGLLIGGTSKVKGRYQGTGGVLIGGTSSVPMNCQPFYQDVSTYLLRTLYRESTSSYWIRISSFLNLTTFFSASVGGDEILCQTSGSSTSCSGQFSTSLRLFLFSGGNTFLNFISYNSSTHIGRFQVPSTFSHYAGEYFDFYNPP